MYVISKKVDFIVDCFFFVGITCLVFIFLNYFIESKIVSKNEENQFEAIGQINCYSDYSYGECRDLTPFVTGNTRILKDVSNIEETNHPNYDLALTDENGNILAHGVHVYKSQFTKKIFVHTRIVEYQN